jgi:hypothetical protein
MVAGYQLGLNFESKFLFLLLPGGQTNRQLFQKFRFFVIPLSKIQKLSQLLLPFKPFISLTFEL